MIALHIITDNRNDDPRRYVPTIDFEIFTAPGVSDGVLYRTEATAPDTFRKLYPDTTGAYTWWSYMFQARAKNAGWRIDYFLVSDRLAEKITATPIYSDVLGSDHCPVGLSLEF